MHDADNRKWPDTLWIVRHAESAGNVARDLAESTGDTRIHLTTRDVDLPPVRLSRRAGGGRRPACAKPRRFFPTYP